MIDIVAASLLSAAFALGGDQQSAPISRRAEVLTSPQPFPEAALREGHNGTVRVSGMLGTDGVFREPTVSQSSGSDVLDAAAVEAVGHWTFSPALGADGSPVATRLTAELEYTMAFRDDYSCRQFVLDSDWYDRVRGRERREELRIYATLRGFSAVAALNSNRSPGNFDDTWDRAIAYCRAHPDRSFRRVFPIP